MIETSSKTLCTALFLVFACGVGRAGHALGPSWAPYEPPTQQQGDSLDEELEALLSGEREEADGLRRRGKFSVARALLNVHLRDDEGDHPSRALLGAVYLDQGDLERAEQHLTEALEGSSDGALRDTIARDLTRLFHQLGRDREARDQWLPILLDPEGALDPSSFFWAAETLVELGNREEATALYRAASLGGAEGDWRSLLARGRSLQRLGDIERAGNTLLRADAAAREANGQAEADVLAALGDIFFEADREVEEGSGRSAAQAYDEALRVNPSHEGALMGLFELHRVNWLRHRRSASEFLRTLLELRPQSVDAHLAAASNNLRVGKLPVVRSELRFLESVAPGRREVQSLAAALAWVEHNREKCELILAGLHGVDPKDSRPERTVGKHLLELYRFAEAKPFLESAVERDPTDYQAWTHLANSLANVGEEDRALEALHRSQDEGGLRQDAWRKNLTLVLERLDREYVVKDFGELSFAWKPDAAPVLEAYLEPFYREAREELAERYGFTPTPTKIEVFRRHQDFSVRSTGFEGFPALGVCFGPVVTALSPISEMRGQFSWARTSFHEFTHVIHLGLSNNRCPRWITEGLATWEEANRNPAWARNLRQDLVDSYANGTIIPVRDLNAAFRGPRIIFGYYEGGLICKMLIERFGFPPMIRLLEAFDRGLDLDQCLREVFEMTPEELDADLMQMVQGMVSQLHIEPRWDPMLLPRKRLALAKEAPTDPAALSEWLDDWCTQAWGSWQQGRRLDAEESLRRIRSVQLNLPTRALFLMGEMALRDGDAEGGVQHWELAFQLGGEDFHSRIFLGNWYKETGEMEKAEVQYLAAEKAFPGFANAGFAAEMKLVELYVDSGEKDKAMGAAARYLDYDAGSYEWRRRVADWHVQAGRHEEAARLFGEANEIDPFSRALHLAWGDALYELGRYEEALREYEVWSLVPLELDLDAQMEPSDSDREGVLAQRSRCYFALERDEEGRQVLKELIELNPKAALEGLSEENQRYLEELKNGK